MINIDLAGLQAIANGFMVTPVLIKHRSANAKDTSNRTGDNVVAFETTMTSVNGWFVDKGTHSFGPGNAMVQVVDRPTLRVPVGTKIASRDEVLLNGSWWTVVDASDDETWSVMIKAELARIE